MEISLMQAGFWSSRTWKSGGAVFWGLRRGFWVVVLWCCFEGAIYMNDGLKLVFQISFSCPITLC
jgi:hypothetical protein